MLRRQEQNFNRPKYSGVSRYKGVNRSKYNKKKPWKAAIQKNLVNKHLGYFKTEEEAALAYNTAAVELFGEFAWINKI